MALLPLTNLSFNAIHIEVGGSTGTTISLNDTDVRGLAYPKPSYNEHGSGLGSSGTIIAVGEFREGYQTVANPEGDWLLAKLSLLSSSQYTFYVSESEEDEDAYVEANSGCTLTVKETSTHLEIWLDEGGDYQRARYTNGTIFDPGAAPYRIWSYAFGTWSGFTAKLNYTSTQQEGSDSLDTSSVTLTTTAQSLSSDRTIDFSTTVSADNGEGSNSSEWSIDCTITFERWGYAMTKAFRIWLVAEADSTEGNGNGNGNGN